MRFWPAVVPEQRRRKIVQQYVAGKDLAQRLEHCTDPKDKSLNTKVYFPEQVYRQTRGIPPDLIVNFGNLAWRALGEVGSGQIHAIGNDTGPDDANHAQDGIFIDFDPAQAARGEIDRKNVPDLCSMIYSQLGVDDTD